MGYSLSLTESCTLFQSLDVNGDGLVSLEELQRAIMHPKLLSDLPISPRGLVMSVVKKKQSFTALQMLTRNLPVSHDDTLLMPPLPLRSTTGSTGSNIQKRFRHRRQNRGRENYELKLHVKQKQLQSFKNEIQECDEYLTMLQHRIKGEQSNWDLYWSALAEQSALVLQTWTRTHLSAQKVKKMRRLKASIVLQKHIRRILEERRFKCLIAMILIQQTARQWNAKAYVQLIRKTKHHAATIIQKHSRRKEAYRLYSYLSRAHVATTRAILQDHFERKNVVVVQRQWRRFCERRKCYRLRVVANAVVLRKLINHAPGRVPDLDDWTIEEELDSLLRKYREWNPQKYYRFRARTPDKVIDIRKRRGLEQQYRARMKEQNKISSISSISCNNLRKETKKVNEKMTQQQHQHQHHGGSHTKQHQTHLNEHDHHFHETPQPQFTKILEERKMHTFARGTTIQYKVRWRGADSKEGWLSREMIMEPNLFPEHCRDIVHRHERAMVQQHHEEHRNHLDEKATIIQRTIFRGCSARLHLWKAQEAAITIQTCYRVGKGKLEARRERLLAERYTRQIEQEQNEMQKQQLKFGDLDKAHTSIGEISCIIQSLQQDLQNEEVSNNRSNSRWTCLKCSYDNEKEHEKCALCLKKRPARDLQGLSHGLSNHE
jgi:hypothetical protein